MTTNPAVSIVIPTYNSEGTIGQTLESIEQQSYGSVETIVVDSNSDDNTKRVCKRYNVNFYTYSGKLLGARYKGLQQASGEYILLLDSDQILRVGCISKCVSSMEEYDMLVLEERPLSNETIVDKLFASDRRLVHEVRDLNPYTSVLLPRFFTTDLLERAFQNIPEGLYEVTIAHDHALIYYEAYKYSKDVGVVSDAVEHDEPSSIVVLLKKNYRYGKSTGDMHLQQYEEYAELIDRKTRFRRGLFQDRVIFDSLVSIVLLSIKGIPYMLGRAVSESEDLLHAYLEC